MDDQAEHLKWALQEIKDLNAQLKRMKEINNEWIQTTRQIEEVLKGGFDKSKEGLIHIVPNLREEINRVIDELKKLHGELTNIKIKFAGVATVVSLLTTLAATYIKGLF